MIYIINIQKISNNLSIFSYIDIGNAVIDYSIADTSFTTISQQILLVDNQQLNAKKCHQTLTVAHPGQMRAEVVMIRPA